MHLHGVIPPVVTPITEDHRFDAASAERLYEHLAGIGVHGLFLFGTSGEGPALSRDVQADALASARRVLGDRLPLLVGCIEPSTDGVIEAARRAADAGATAIVACPPTYVPATQEEMRVHFRAIREAVDLPLVAYDIPFTVKTKIEPRTLLDLAGEGTIVALKDSSGDTTSFRRLLLARPEGFDVLTGSELLFDHVLAAGADGIVPGLANVAAEPFVRLYDAFQRGDLDAVRREQDFITRLFEVFVDPATDQFRIGYAFATMKTAAALRGLIACDQLCLPTRRATEGQRSRIERILRELEILQ
jgi:4-hydroxy-tetrahydrodipicolinate synthase